MSGRRGPEPENLGVLVASGDPTLAPRSKLLSRRGFLRVTVGAAAAAAAPFVLPSTPFSPTIPPEAHAAPNERVAAASESFQVTGPMLTAYESEGGINALGPAISRPFPDRAGRLVQVFNQGGIQLTLGSDKRVTKTELWNIYDELDNSELDNPTDLIPPTRNWSSDPSRWGHNSQGPLPGTVEANHVNTIFGELDRKGFPQLRNAYLSNPKWFERFGLPTSWKDYGNVVVVRCNRTLLQLWKDRTGWTSAPMTVVTSNAGLDAKRFGMIPQEALAPQAYATEPIVEPIKSKEVAGELKNRVGWAYNAKPDISFEEMLTDMNRMKREGANVVYIGHINPNVVETMPAEPGLGYAVYHARKTGYNKEAQNRAEDMFQGVIRSLEAAKEAGLSVVLPVGYQIEMGEQWIRENQFHLRKNPDGTNMNHWGVEGISETASPYSPKYRQEISEYYQWVQNNIVSKYPNILALNLGDEPMGGDFSYWAKQEFQNRYGTSFDSADLKLQGEFQSGVLADYATWSANLWKEINPGVKTMMTFHIQREVPYFPNFEKIFQKTPDTFVFSADTHMHDGLPNGGVSAAEVNLLYGMSRHLSWLSNTYGKDLMLWTAANAWGLSSRAGNAPSGSGINEARENVRIVTDVAKQNGAKIAMIMAWGYNMGNQGLFYDNDGTRTYNPDEMFNQISKDMAVRRDTLSDQIYGRPDTVIYIPADVLYRRIARDKISHVIDQNNPWIDLNKYDFRNRNIVYLTDGAALEKAKQAGSQIIKVDI